MTDGRRASTLDRVTVRRVVVVVLAALCVVVAAQAGPWQPTSLVEDRAVTVEPSASPPPSVLELPPELAPEPADGAEPGPDLRRVGQVLMIAAAAAALVLLARWALRRQWPVRPPAPDPVPGGPAIGTPRTDPEPDVDVLQDGARAAEEHLRTAAAPADAVIAAWVALEGAAARSGVVRERSATATEFTLHVLDRTPADPAAARTLLALYLRARFDDQPLADADVRAAAGAARALVDTLVGRVVDRAPEPGSEWRRVPSSPEEDV